MFYSLLTYSFRNSSVWFTRLILLVNQCISSDVYFLPNSLTSARWPSDVKTWVTVISFFVRVPVLSEQMTLQQPARNSHTVHRPESHKQQHANIHNNELQRPALLTSCLKWIQQLRLEKVLEHGLYQRLVCVFVLYFVKTCAHTHQECLRKKRWRGKKKRMETVIW